MSTLNFDRGRTSLLEVCQNVGVNNDQTNCYKLQQHGSKPKRPQLVMGKLEFSSKVSLLLVVYFMLTLVLLSQPLLAVPGTAEVHGEAVKTGRSLPIYSRKLLEEDNNGADDDGGGKGYIQRAPRQGPPSPIANLSRRAGVDQPPPPPPPLRRPIIYRESRPSCPRCQIP